MAWASELQQSDRKGHQWTCKMSFLVHDGWNLSLCSDRDVTHLINDPQLGRVVCHLHIVKHGRLVLQCKTHVDNLVWCLRLWDINVILRRLCCGHLPLLCNRDVHPCRWSYPVEPLLFCWHLELLGHVCESSRACQLPLSRGVLLHTLSRDDPEDVNGSSLNL